MGQLEARSDNSGTDDTGSMWSQLCFISDLFSEGPGEPLKAVEHASDFSKTNYS